MFSFNIILFYGLLPAFALSQCSCGNTNLEFSSSIINRQIENPKNGTGAACARNCTYYFTYTGSGSYSFYAFFIAFSPATNDTECLTFFDGIGTNGNRLGSKVCHGASDVPIASLLPTMTMVLTTSTSTPLVAATFQVNITVGAALTTPTTTTQLTTTTPYEGTYVCNPATVQLDAVLLLDTSGVVSHATFNQMKSNMDDLLSTLNIQPNNPTYSQVTGAYVSPRLSLNGMSNPWQQNGPGVSAWFQFSATYNPDKQRSYFVNTLTSLRDNALKIDPVNDPLRRAQAPALLYILSGSGILDSELAMANDTANDLKHWGVHIVTVQVGQPNNIGNLASPGLDFSYSDGSALSDNGVNDFINDIACNGNKMCGGCGTSETVQVAEGSPVPINLVQGTGYYCNNMNCSFTYNAEKGLNVSIDIKWFNVELQHDFIEVYDGNMQRLMILNGYNANGAHMTVGTSSIMVKFTSNSNNVFTGFSGTVSAVRSRSTGEVFVEGFPNPK